ncbi:hypothetical protein AMELA_G00096570 [Ameiurus melas]|uniref:Uncharacterized protein n=1 Tax=Ameiurus melas TaxID=219545 RepID=A0A7J6AUE4_AMEME|nr:hypothetical protein AMELA_G00096570 [Ameiurus melas]
MMQQMAKVRAVGEERETLEQKKEIYRQDLLLVDLNADVFRGVWDDPVHSSVAYHETLDSSSHQPLHFLSHDQPGAEVRGEGDDKGLRHMQNT